MMLSGARQGAMSGIRRVIATAMSRDLSAFVLPGPAIARSRGLDLAGSNLIIVGTPRHAGVLIIVGPIAEGLQDAAAVVYAQMPRPRAILALGAGDIAPLPAADVSAPLTQDGLQSGLAELRRFVAAGAFHVDAADFTAAALEVRIEYTCPMHPEVVSDEPGKCPKCGMTLVKAGSEGGHGHKGHGGHGGHSSEPVDGIEPHFMSMVELTKDQPRSSDGLQMEWIEAPFGPFFPGLPAGLHLSLTLDGDTVAGSDAWSLVGMADLPGGTAMAPGQFVDHLAAMQSSPIAYRALACAAIEDAAGIAFGADDRRARAAAIERERIASHLSWLAEFGVQTGFLWLAGRAGALQLAVQGAGAAEIAALAGPIGRLIRRVQAAPLMRMRLRGIGRVGKDRVAWGPVDRARGGGSDARSDDATLKELGFGIRVRNGGDALARMMLRCDEIDQSIGLIATAGTLAAPMLADVGVVSGEGAASIETPRGAARLTVTLTDGKVTGAELKTPSTAHLALIDDLTRQRELGDALVAIGSLDLSPWEMRG